jgi:hypothetical protein
MFKKTFCISGQRPRSKPADGESVYGFEIAEGSNMLSLVKLSGADLTVEGLVSIFLTKDDDLADEIVGIADRYVRKSPYRLMWRDNSLGIEYLIPKGGFWQRQFSPTLTFSDDGRIAQSENVLEIFIPDLSVILGSEEFPEHVSVFGKVAPFVEVVPNVDLDDYISPWSFEADSLDDCTVPDPV